MPKAAVAKAPPLKAAPPQMAPLLTHQHLLGTTEVRRASEIAAKQATLGTPVYFRLF